jgi:hypothetical protein
MKSGDLLEMYRRVPTRGCAPSDPHKSYIRPSAKIPIARPMLLCARIGVGGRAREPSA